jgi:hypothetical protein
MGNFKEKAVQQVISQLNTKGDELIRKAVERSNVRLEYYSKNLIDAYGYGVYYRGRLMTKGYYSASPMATDRHKTLQNVVDINGREEVEKYLNTYPANDKSFELIIVNAAYYARFLEDGSYAIGLSKIFGTEVTPKSYHVISQVYRDLEAYSKNFKNAVIKDLS